MRPGTLCVIEPPTRLEASEQEIARQLAGLVVTTAGGQHGYWRVLPPAMVRSDLPWIDADGLQPPGSHEVAIQERWLRPLDGNRQPAAAFAADETSFAWG